VNPAAADSPKTLFGQPVGLTFLFLTEMWEKFSFYGMRALLVYYMTKQLAMAQGQASLVYGVYTAFVYFTPIFGGIVSDRWLGRRRSILIGGSVMAAGHFMMATVSSFRACRARSASFTDATIRAASVRTTFITSE
jgi:POT family proton-dependent oligopeptide transporter